MSGAEGFASSIVGGATGLWRDPYRGLKRNGTKGFVKGIATGLAGFIAKPVAGTIGVAAQTFRGARNYITTETVQPLPVRTKRYVDTDFILVPYSTREARGAQVLPGIGIGTHIGSTEDLQGDGGYIYHTQCVTYIKADTQEPLSAQNERIARATARRAAENARASALGRADANNKVSSATKARRSVGAWLRRRTTADKSEAKTTTAAGGAASSTPPVDLERVAREAREAAFAAIAAMGMHRQAVQLVLTERWLLCMVDIQTQLWSIPLHALAPPPHGVRVIGRTVAVSLVGIFEDSDGNNNGAHGGGDGGCVENIPTGATYVVRCRSVRDARRLERLVRYVRLGQSVKARRQALAWDEDDTISHTNITLRRQRGPRRAYQQQQRALRLLNGYTGDEEMGGGKEHEESGETAAGDHQDRVRTPHPQPEDILRILASAAVITGHESRYQRDDMPVGCFTRCDSSSGNSGKARLRWLDGASYGGPSFTVYRIEVRSADDNHLSWVVYRRYSEFRTLREELSKRLKMPLWSMPFPKRAGNLRFKRRRVVEKILRERKEGLQFFLNQLQRKDWIRRSDELRGFLTRYAENVKRDEHTVAH